ncbi:L,D-transpeptidase [Kaistia defluvii]|uniref:Lipoprotein-anchoring transpeptidase ErfK/SrfK n=1 Tax=Kaistia defluvii TaxID=410841 RepID=A0ABV2R5M9_9HYPH
MFVAWIRVALVPSLLALGSASLHAQEWREPYPEEAQPERYYSEPAYPEPAYRDPAYREPGYAPDEAPRYVEPAAPVSAPAPAASAPIRRATAPLSADFIAQANEAPMAGIPAKSDKPDPQVLKLQVLLDRVHVSPGVIDGRQGGNLNKAISALQSMHNMPPNGRLGPEIWDLLQVAADRPVLMDYTISDKDVAGPFVPVMPKDYAEMAALPKLAYRDPVELLGEKFHMDENFLRNLNPDADFTVAGTIITVVDVGPNAKAKVAHLVADASTRQLLGYNENWDVVVAYPATIGSADLPSPSGIHAVKAVAENPEYWYRPKVNFQQGNNDKPLKLASGPNNPVGTVWIGLDKPTYGIHGSPEPSKIDKTNSHGCLRLTNWDAQELVKLVKPGVDVEFVDQTPTASVAPAPAPAPVPVAVEAGGEQAMPPPLQ